MIKLPTKLIAPTFTKFNENEKKNESPTSEAKMSYKTIIRPKPLNLNVSTGKNGQPINRKLDYESINTDFYWKINSNHKYYMVDNSFSK
jgi:hypothetical protein